MLGSQLGFAWSRCGIDSEALPAAKAAGVEAEINEPGVASSQRHRKFAIPSVSIARDHPDYQEARVEWSMDTPHAPSLCVHSIPATSSAAKSGFSPFFSLFHSLFTRNQSKGLFFLLAQRE